jgi:hypothetical protein
MKKPIFFSVLFSIFTAMYSFSQSWIEETIDPDTGLRTGVINYNGREWKIEPNKNFSGQDFSGVDLANANLSGAWFNETNLSEANLRKANLKGAQISKTNFVGADLTEAVLSEVEGSSADFSDAILKGSNFVNASISVSRFGGSFIEGTNFSGAYLGGARLQNANIKNAIFDNAELRDARIDRTNLGGSSFYNIYRGSLDISNMKAIEGINSELETIKKQLQNLMVDLEQKDDEIARLKKLSPNEQVQEGRAGSVVLSVDPDGNNITLGLTIEQSDNLIEWTKLDGEMTRTIPIPEGKKFYRFALDK